MKRSFVSILICCLLALALTFSLVSCGGEDEDNKETQQTEGSNSTESSDSGESTEGDESIESGEGTESNETAESSESTVCEHEYDNSCDTECNNCGAQREANHPECNCVVDCVEGKSCHVCGALVTPGRGEHIPEADDGDCTTELKCDACGKTLVEAKPSHTAGADDGDCTTAVKCVNCDKNAVEAKPAHIAGADDGDCTTAVKCVNCDKNAVEAKSAHIAGADDGDCTTALKCAHCDKIAVEAKPSHTAGADDGDCTTAVKCANCAKIVIAAEAAHIAGADDGDCTTAVKCVNCDKNAIAAKPAHIAGEDDGDCTTAIKCVYCEKNAVEAKLEHIQGEDDDDCSTAVGCVNCEKIVVEAKEHDFSVYAYDSTSHWLCCANEGCKQNNKGTLSQNPIHAQASYIMGSAAFSSEQAYNLFDGKTSTKWCSSTNSGTNNYVVFSFGSEVKLVSYTLTTASDTAQYPGRNWKAWKIFGSNTEGEDKEWDEIYYITNAVIPAKNCVETEPFEVDATEAYKYYKLEILEYVGGNSESVQQMSGIDFTVIGSLVEKHYGGESYCSGGKFCEACGYEYDTTKDSDNHIYNSEGICDACEDEARVGIRHNNGDMIYVNTEEQIKAVLSDIAEKILDSNASKKITIRRMFDTDAASIYSIFKTLRTVLETYSDMSGLEITIENVSQVPSFDECQTFGDYTNTGVSIAKISKLYLPDVKIIGGGVFYNSTVEYVSAPSVELIGDYAFYECTELKTLILDEKGDVNKNAIQFGGVTSFYNINENATLVISCASSGIDLFADIFAEIIYVHPVEDECFCEACDVVAHSKMDPETGKCELCEVMLAEASITSDSGTIFYETFADALGNWTKGTTLSLCKNIKVANTISVTDKGLTLDLNGYTLDSDTITIHVETDGELILADQSNSGGGMIKGRIAIKADGTLSFVTPVDLDGTDYEIHINTPIKVECDLSRKAWQIHMDTYGLFVIIGEQGSGFYPIAYDANYSVNSNRTEFVRVN